MRLVWNELAAGSFLLSSTVRASFVWFLGYETIEVGVKFGMAAKYVNSCVFIPLA